MKKNVCIIGLGYVGLTLGVYLARKGLQVYGIEISDTILDSLTQGKAHFYEENFDTELKQVIESGLFSFGKNYKEADGRIYYIITIGTPLNEDGNIDLKALHSVGPSLSNILKDDDVVILRSTVKIGTTRLMMSMLDVSGKKYHLGYCPERTLEGAAFEELSTLPQIISGIDEASMTAIEDLFAPVSRRLIRLPNVEEAEMVKLLNNSERDLMFALANEIALMADAKNLNAYRIIEAANFEYKRSNLKKPGLVGGPCLEKDPYILTESFQNDTYIPTLFVNGRKINASIVERGLDHFFQYYKSQNKSFIPKKIALLGFAFKGKPPTGDMRGSLVKKVIDKLKKSFPYGSVYGHDYLATLEDMRLAGVQIASNNIEEILTGADLIIFQNNHPGYARENWEKLGKIVSDHCLIYDFWNQLSSEQTSKISYYSALGRIS